MAPDDLRDRMLAISTDEQQAVLPALLRRYKGDAARNWAAAVLGPDKLDALIAQHGDGWYPALPEDVRVDVAQHIAFLGARGSKRALPADPAAVATRIVNQPGSDGERRQKALDELNWRMLQADRTRQKVSTNAAAEADALANELGDAFTSIAQIPPAVRRDLSKDAVDRLVVRATRNMFDRPRAESPDLSLTNPASGDAGPREASRDLRNDLPRGSGVSGDEHDEVDPSSDPHNSIDDEVVNADYPDLRDLHLAPGDATSAIDPLRAMFDGNQQGAGDKGVARPTISGSSGMIEASLAPAQREDRPDQARDEPAITANGQQPIPDRQAEVGPDIIVRARIRRPQPRPQAKPPKPPVKKGKPAPPADYGHFVEYWNARRKAGLALPVMIPAPSWKQYKPNPNDLTRASLDGNYNRITLHHTGNYSDPRDVENLDRGHEPTLHYLGRWIKNFGDPEHYKGYGDITYHFLISRDGKIYEGRSLLYQGAHVSGQNPRNIRVAFMGDYSRQPLTPEQVHSAKYLIRELNGAYGIYRNAGGGPYIFTHRELAPAAGVHSRPLELFGAQAQVDAIKKWSLGATKPVQKK